MTPAPCFARAADGSKIAFYDFGGAGEALLLAHATGFCAHVLEPMVSHLTRRFRCIALDSRWHGRSVAVEGFTGDWRGFRDDVLAVVETAGLEEPVGFGHSCGGTALLLAEELCPRTFSRLYCYEAVVLATDDPPEPSLESPMAAAALRRRGRFSSRTAALANFAAKPPLCDLDPAVLEAYVEHGFWAEDDGSVVLRCTPEHEALTYAHGLSHHAYRDLSEVAVPVTLSCGATSKAPGRDSIETVAERLSAGRVEVFEALDHLGPMQHPDLVAASIIRAADTPPA